MSGFTLDDLEAIIARRAVSDDEASYTRRLVGRGMSVCAKKLGEEAVETALAAVAGTRDELVAEAADLLYHLLVVLKVAEVPLSTVTAELHRRTAQTGLEEKAARPAERRDGA
ncbi:phosphoribosyl-ATP diphosphatase [Siculibacillus lacustris]|uniref:Phosphoribosyl-ATP pyrophosphatase n=1 Tax=Siculibacillus lacustris TaxID=1549641 RepID=A0A4Q9VY08_9HYPH|nr:phosphoribosyl-ATP diphosphatase [Siculibacillus lacustris]TBW41270.1 phosphoribosyl-ATP diphosphatase [Siculibacillus lacustris]